MNFYFCIKSIFMEIVTHTWHWAISGFLIGVVMLLLNYFGKVFGMSSNLRSLCSMTGVGKRVPFFEGLTRGFFSPFHPRVGLFLTGDSSF